MLTLEGLKIELGSFSLSADFTVETGDFAAIIGASGGGKSTLLSCVAGFLAPSRGRVLWEGKDLSPLDPGARPVSILFQDNNLFPHLSLMDNTGMALRPDIRLSKDQRSLVEGTLADVGLAGMSARKPSELSGGQQSRAALARVLLADRPIVLLDEPFAALGPRLKVEMLELIETKLVAAGKTILMVTHHPDDARRFAKSVIFLHDGIAGAPRPVDAFFTSPSDALRDYLGGR